MRNLISEFNRTIWEFDTNLTIDSDVLSKLVDLVVNGLTKITDENTAEKYLMALENMWRVTPNHPAVEYNTPEYNAREIAWFAIRKTRTNIWVM